MKLTKQEMIDEMTPYWQSKGWKLETLNSKSEYQVKGIYNDFIKRCIKAQNDREKNIKNNKILKGNSKNNLKEEQLTLF